MNWWHYYYHNFFNKLLKTELQEIGKEYDLNLKQNKKDLINELVEKNIPKTSDEILTSNLDEISYPHPRTVQYLPHSHEFTIDNRNIRISESLRLHETFLRHKLIQLNNVNHEDIKFEIHSILDIIKKPNTIPIQQPQNIIPILFDHQKQNISWMKQLEENIDDNDKLVIKNYWPYLIPLHDQLVYSCYNYRFHYHIPMKISLSYRGGILADSVGCGKTLTCIGLGIEKQRKPFDNYSKANLVLCPSHLVQQWFDEIINNTIGMKVCMIRTKKDWDLLSYYDLMTCNFVIVSHQFLTNLNYNPNLIWTDYNQKQCNLELINWHRIFLDEGHELVYNQKVFSKIMNLKATYKWYVSGTPFIDGHILDYPDHCVFHIARFLGIDISMNEIVSPENVHCIRPNMEFMHELVKLMIRNTKESINLKLPPINIEDKMLTFHKTEKGRYDIAKNRGRTTRKWLLQLCCSMNLADQDIKEFGVEKTLEQIHDIMIKNQENKLKQKKKTLENTLPKREETVITQERQENINRLTKEIKEIEISLVYLKTVLNQITNEQSCPVCLEVIEDLAITDCGHVFCSSCIEQCLEMTNKCPNCRNITNYMIVSKEKEDKNIDMINKYGTKISELINFLKQNPGKVIIFSQWDRLLHKVGKVLIDEGFPNVFCQGSVYQRNKSLQEFRKKNIQILMMSLNYAVSGSNLTESNNVIILDIYDGTKEDIEKKENQAIGRIHRIGQTKPVTVIRFVMNETLEEELYKKLYIKSNDISSISNISETSEIVL